MGFGWYIAHCRQCPLVARTRCFVKVALMLVGTEVWPDSSLDATNMDNSTIKVTNKCNFTFKPTDMDNSSFVTYLSRLGLALLHQGSEVTLLSGS